MTELPLAVFRSLEKRSVERVCTDLSRLSRNIYRRDGRYKAAARPLHGVSRVSKLRAPHRFRRQFAELFAVFVREIAKMPEAPARRHFGDGTGAA